MGEIAPSAKDGSDSSKRTSSNYARYVFWIMFAICFVNYMDRYVLTGAANVVAKELGFDLDGIGYITSAFLVVYTVCALPVGAIADRVKRKDVVAVCVALWSLATGFTALAGNFAGLFVARMFLGIGEAGYFPAGTALLSDYYSRARRSLIMSWWSVAQLIGILAGYVLGGFIADLYFGSWRLAFIFTAVPGLFLAFFAWRLREPRRNEADEEANLAASSAETAPELEAIPTHTPRLSILAQYRTVLQVKTVIVLTLMQIFGFFVTGVNTAFLPTYLQQRDTFGLTSGQAGLFSGLVIVLAGMAGTMVGGYMADVLNRRHPGARVLICGIGFLLGAPSFAIAVTYHDFLIFTIFFIVTTFMLTVNSGPSTAAIQDVVPSSVRASAVAVSLFASHMFGDAFAPSIVGVISTLFDPTHGGHFKAGLAGQDLSMALLVTCTPALVLAGLVGIFGARWMHGDVVAAEEVDRRARAAQA